MTANEQFMTSYILTSEGTVRDGGMAAQNAPAKWYSLMADQFHESSEPATFTFRAPAPQYSCYVFRNSGTSHVLSTWAEPVKKTIFKLGICFYMTCVHNNT